jgi:DNA-binding NtrC family response regulator
VVVVSADDGLRQRLCASLHGMRWHVREARGGAEAMAQVEDRMAEAVLLDAWLPDLDVAEVAERIEAMAPDADVLRVDGSSLGGRTRSPKRHELLHALREATSATVFEEVYRGAERGDAGGTASMGADAIGPDATSPDSSVPAAWDLDAVRAPEPSAVVPEPLPPARAIGAPPQGVEELVGRSAAMLEVARLVRLVAPRSTTVLIEGETGTGKEVVAKALHRLSARANKPFVVLNCAAIPEALLEAELFGHTRGAFTGAVHSRTGRIEAAHGGTLFLDEIGEMPLALQAKMLRFLENGEIQRVGENDTARVDVRVIAATHQLLEQRAAEGTFRLDLYHRLAVFPVEVPPLRDRLEDIGLLAEHFLAMLGRSAPRKTLSADAMERLLTHLWPGNVRELAHVLERATILAGDAPVIGAEEIRVRRVPRGSLHGHRQVLAHDGGRVAAVA